MSSITTDLEEEIAPRVAKAFDLASSNKTLARQVATLAIALQDFDLFREQCGQRFFEVKNALVLKEVYQKVIAGIKKPCTPANGPSVASFSEFTAKAETLQASAPSTGGLQRKDMSEVFFSPMFKFLFLFSQYLLFLVAF